MRKHLFICLVECSKTWNLKAKKCCVWAEHCLCCQCVLARLEPRLNVGQSQTNSTGLLTEMEMNQLSRRSSFLIYRTVGRVTKLLPSWKMSAKTPLLFMVEIFARLSGLESTEIRWRSSQRYVSLRCSAAGSFRRHTSQLTWKRLSQHPLALISNVSEAIKTSVTHNLDR